MPAITNTRSSNSDALGRYYTKTDISEFLVDQIEDHHPRRLLDLGAGSGSLSIAAASRWGNLDLLTVDIDARVADGYKTNLGNSNLKFSSHKHFHTDALSNDLPSLLNTFSNPIDTAVCNPPFISPEWTSDYSDLLEETGFIQCLPIKSSIDAAVLFLAQNLRLIGKNATLGIILPDSFITAAKYKKFRQHLLTNYEVVKVIQLPRGSFHGTDALASIFIIKKTNTSSGLISIYKLDESRKLSGRLQIPTESGFGRLDYNFHCQAINQNRSSDITTLESVKAIINRGTLSSSEAKQYKAPVFHTSDISEKDCGIWKDLSRFDVPPNFDSKKNLITGEPGDILIARVGRNLETKILGISKGTIILTDCIYRIRVPEHLRAVLLSALSSENGRKWLSLHAYGVAAKHLTKLDLLSFPLQVNQ
jgi:type I restriction enzyme M protein